MPDEGTLRNKVTAKGYGRHAKLAAFCVANQPEYVQIRDSHESRDLSQGATENDRSSSRSLSSKGRRQTAHHSSGHALQLVRGRKTAASHPVSGRRRSLRGPDCQCDSSRLRDGMYPYLLVSS